MGLVDIIKSTAVKGAVALGILTLTAAAEAKPKHYNISFQLAPNCQAVKTTADKVATCLANDHKKYKVVVEKQENGKCAAVIKLNQSRRSAVRKMFALKPTINRCNLSITIRQETGIKPSYTGKAKQTEPTPFIRPAPARPRPVQPTPKPTPRKTYKPQPMQPTPIRPAPKPDPKPRAPPPVYKPSTKAKELQASGHLIEYTTINHNNLESLIKNQLLKDGATSKAILYVYDRSTGDIPVMIRSNITSTFGDMTRHWKRLYKQACNKLVKVTDRKGKKKFVCARHTPVITNAEKLADLIETDHFSSVMRGTRFFRTRKSILTKYLPETTRSSSFETGSMASGMFQYLAPSGRFRSYSVVMSNMNPQAISHTSLLINESMLSRYRK